MKDRTAESTRRTEGARQRDERRRRRRQSYGRTERCGGDVSAAAAAGVTGDVRETYEAWAMISGHQRFPGQPMLPRRPLLSPTDHRRTNNKISTVTTYPQRLHCLIAIRGGPARGGSRLPLSLPPSLPRSLPTCLPHPVMASTAPTAHSCYHSPQVPPLPLPLPKPSSQRA